MNQPTITVKLEYCPGCDTFQYADQVCDGRLADRMFEQENAFTRSDYPSMCIFCWRDLQVELLNRGGGADAKLDDIAKERCTSYIETHRALVRARLGALHNGRYGT